jgi:hypothetical protein
VRLLPGHDQWVMGPGTADEHVTPASRRELVTRKANPVIVGGVVRATWKVRSGQVVVSGLDDDVPRQALAQEVARISVIVGRRSLAEDARVRDK